MGVARFWSVLFVLCCAYLVVFGATWTGLLASTPGGPFRCSDLSSSGGDDDAMLLAFTLSIFPLGLRLWRWKCPPDRFELAVLGAALGVSVLSLFLAQLDCAEIMSTLLLSRDWEPRGALMAVVLAPLALWNLRRVAPPR